jgi:pimeloyl-ACP methyl ester carboxylesterase
MREPGFVTAGGHHLEYRLLPGDGVGGRPALVFLHEGLGSVAMWRDAPAAVAARTGCPALVYSRHGYGESDPLTAPRAADFMRHEARQVLPEVLRALSLDDVLLIGHSDGATIALEYLAAGLPARAAIVLAPHVVEEEQTWRPIEKLVGTWGRDGLRERLARYHRDPDGAFRGWSEAWLSPAMREWDLVPRLATIRCPILAIQGEDDIYGSMVHVEQIAAASGGPVTIAKLAGCGHDPFREQPERTVELCAAFIARHGGRAAEGEAA